MIAAVNSEVVAEPAIARYEVHEDAMDGNQAIRPRVNAAHEAMSGRRTSHVRGADCTAVNDLKSRAGDAVRQAVEAVGDPSVH